MRAAAELTVRSGGRMYWRCTPPLVLRPTGADRVHLVHAAGGPVGGDDLRIELTLAAGTRLQLCTAAATVVQPGLPARPTTAALAADLATGAELDWRPEPTVVCDGAELVSHVHLRLAAGAGATAREVVVLGRQGQRGGRYRGELRVDVAGQPLLAHTTVLDGADDALGGPGGIAGHRVVGMLLAAGSLAGPPPGAGQEPGLHWACTPLAGPGRLLMAVGDTAEPVTRCVTTG